MSKGRTLSIALALAALTALVAGCGKAQDTGNYGGHHPDYARALAGSPPALAALHRQADKLLPGGTAAYEKRIAALHGYPVVTNVWASWCADCRLEFPLLQKLSAHYGKRVAFLGVDSDDADDTASGYLKEAPVSYPSYTDPDEKIASSIGVSFGLPDTAFYNRAGKLVYLKQGPYEHNSELEADVRRYALGS